MAEMHAFRGYRYDLGRVGPLAEVIAPPYDVIDDALSAKLHALNPYNAIRLILDPEKPTDTDKDNRYTRTARRLNLWLKDGIIAEERDPCVYAYYQTFDWEGMTFTRRGFMTRVRLEKFGVGKIYPHEETLSGPKADRLKLFHATGMNLSQIFGLFPDEENAVVDRLDRAVKGQTPLQAVDHLGVTHQMWMLSDPKLITDLQGLMGPKPIFIADGHHRYETGLRHLEDRQAAGLVKGPDDPANFILMMLVGMSDPGLQVMPTHRLINGLGELRAETLHHFLKDHFELETLGAGDDAGDRLWTEMQATGRQDVLGFNTPADRVWTRATLRSPASMDAIVLDHSTIWKSLGVSILHRLVLDELLGREGKPSCKYVHLADEVFDAVRTRACQLACLVQPATVEHVRLVAGGLEKMPPKSTYFYPKLASGMVFNPIQP